MTVPARGVLTEATATNDRLGHENLGFLSESHGFMPRRPPLTALPPSHAVWDAVAADLPHLWRNLALRTALEAMPVLGASRMDLPDRYLLRASTIVSIFAHAYHYLDPEPPAAIPVSVSRPWAQIGRRLGRPKPHLSFSDLNIYNWRLIDPDLPDPMRVENLDLMVKIVGNEDERRFQAAPIEMVARFSPAVGAVVRAQEAVVGDHPGALKASLMEISDVLRTLTYDSFMKVDPNPSGPTYVNPVVWAKTVAPLATPYQAEEEGIPGPSGTAIPSFQLLDIFYGRQTLSTSVGQETARARKWFPPHWRDFLAAAEAVDVAGYVRRNGDPTLRGLFDESLEAYAGETGLLGRHRLKTYGFLDLSFKAGRTKTLGGFGGGFGDRLWDRMDGELDLARLERYTGHPPSCRYATVARVQPAAGEPAADEAGGVRHVVLDVAGCGVRYETGSRCAVLPENGAELVERTRRALLAHGDEPVQLNPVWLDAVRLRDGYERARVLSLDTLLTFGRIRPVSRQVAKSLYAMTRDEALRRVIEARAEDQWELWELLEVLTAKGFNPRGLWKAHPGDREGICRIVPPERFRMYSISCARGDQATSTAEEIHLTVGPLRYETPATDLSPAGRRAGTGSSFLCSLADEPERRRRVSIRVVQPPRFRLPADASRPIVMLAGGTGLAPFRSLLQGRVWPRPERAGGENWLFLGTRTRAEVYYADELDRMVAEGSLNLRVAYSQEDGRHVGDDMVEAGTAAELWRLLQDGAHVYVCGRTGFATSVIAALSAVVERFAPGQAHATLARLTGEGRLMQEIYTTYAGRHSDQRTFDASEVVRHNDDDEGYWLVIDGRVYDVTAFSDLHPGGTKIIRSYAGMDATAAYRRARHDVSPEVDAMLPMYEIGAVRRLDLGAGWAVAIGPHGLQTVTLKDLYRAWLGLLYTAVEMENALANDYGARDEPVTVDECDGALAESPYKTRMLLGTHERFMSDYLGGLTGEKLADLWAVTTAFDHEHHAVGWLADRTREVKAAYDAVELAQLERHVVACLRTGQRDAVAWAADRCRRLEVEDRRFLREMKLALRSGVQVLERWEGQAASAAASTAARDLVAAASALAEVLRGYYERAAE